jgi:glycogen synthase
VVRRTGGLADTVKDVDAADAGETPNGFTFDGVDEASEDGALDRALAYFRRKDWWAEVCDVLLSPGETNQR